MPVQSEAALENGLIDTLQKMNYEYVHIQEEKNLSANFKKQLEKHNKKKLEELGRTEFTESEFEKILIYLEGGTRFEKAKKLRDLFPLELESGERLWVEFLNRTHWCQNEFQVSNQITVEGRKKCRYDVTILINGLPLVQIELKRRGVELKQAYNQIQRYHKTSFHGLFDYIQLFVISNGVNTRYFANNPNSGYKFTFTGRTPQTFHSMTWRSLPQCSSTSVRWARLLVSTLYCMRETNVSWCFVLINSMPWRRFLTVWKTLMITAMFGIQQEQVKP